MFYERWLKICKISTSELNVHQKSLISTSILYFHEIFKTNVKTAFHLVQYHALRNPPQSMRLRRKEVKLLCLLTKNIDFGL